MHRVLKLTGVLILLTFVLLPVFWMVSASLRVPEDLFTRPPKFWINKVTIYSYQYIFSHTLMPQYFLNSFIIAVLTMLLTIGIAAPAAYSVNRLIKRGRRTLVLTTLVAYVFPPILLFLPLYLTFTSLGFTQTPLAVAIADCTFTVPFCLWFLIGFFKRIPLELEEAAMVDGANRFTTLVRVVLPLAAPGVFSSGIFAFILSWNEYLYASVLLTGRLNRTFTIGIYDFIAQFDVNWGAIMAAATLGAIPVIIFFALIQKYFVEGLTAGALKG